MESSVAEALAHALEYHKRGRLADAEAGYREVLQRVPDQPDALHRLGVIAHQIGRDDVALQLIGRAIAVNPGHHAYYGDAGSVLHALGRIDEAIAHYRRALALAPSDVKAHNGIGIALRNVGRLEDAAASFRAALALKPDFAEARGNLGNVLREAGRPAEAVESYRAALQSAPASASLWYNLGNALKDLGAFDEALHAWRKALSLDARFAEVHTNIGDALLAQGRPDDAAASYARALQIRDVHEAIAGFLRSLSVARLRDAGTDVRAIAMRALSTPWARPSALAPSAIRLVAGDPAMRACIDRAWGVWPVRLHRQDLFGEAEHVVFDDPLLRTLLESAPVCDLRMERFLTLARSALLDDVANGLDPQGASALAFCCALARQSFINDYVFSCNDTELAQARTLRDGLGASLHRGEAPPAVGIAVVAAYFPLHSVPNAEALLRRAWPESVDALVTQQLREPLDERRWRERIARLTPIDDEVSLRVRQQYEEHPYPRWINLSRVEPGSVVGRDARRAPKAGHRAVPIDVLVAGCGTGQESIEVAQRLPHARVLAIDLSLASLAYAARKAHELQVGNIEHAQADILKLSTLGRRFDQIYAVGVAHHLADPVRGLRKLAALLAPGGYMLVGLYSERSRQDVVAARAFIAERGYAPTDADIRRCRQDLMSVDGGERFARLASRTDFYVTSECRDLLFHVQEHRFTLPEIKRVLDALRLRFEGFVMSAQLAACYQARYGATAGLDDIENWEAFESDFPDAFAGMYIFWVRKADP